MSDNIPLEAKWLETIAKALCFICLHQAKLDEKSVLTKVNFLATLGLDTADAAHVAGSSAASVAELRRRVKNKGKRSGKKKAKSKRR